MFINNIADQRPAATKTNILYHNVSNVTALVNKFSSDGGDDDGNDVVINVHKYINT